MPGIWEEVKTRKIFKAATIYAAVAWGLIQIADILFPVLGVQEWVMSSMVLIAFSGFPVALIIGWFLDIKIERRNQKAAAAHSTDNDNQSNLKVTEFKPNFAARVAEFAVISLFGLSAAYLYYNSTGEPAKASIISESESIQQMVAPKPQQKTIAVLPFANFTDSTDDEFFADGLSEELLNVLARNKKLRVAARTSSFEYKNTNINVRRIAQELGVEYILEGSVRRAGDVIRVTAQLIEANTDTHVFSKTWDRTTTDVFKVQDEIAQSVLQELKVNLLGEVESSQSEIGTQNIAAFAEYSKGLAFLRNRSQSDFENAIIHFKQALSIDTQYAEAMAMLAETYLLQVSYGLIQFKQAHQQAKPYIEKALSISPLLGSAHAVKGLMHWQLANQQYSVEKAPEKGDSTKTKDQTVVSKTDKKASQVASFDAMNKQLETAKSHFAQAIEINPSLAEAYMWYGSVLQQQGQFADGAKLHQKAYEIDPRAAVVGFNRAMDLIRYGDYKQAMDVFNAVVRNNPNYPNAYSIAGEVSFAVGQLDQAYSMYNRLATLSDDKFMWLINSSRIFIPLGQYELAQNNIEQLNKEQNKPINKLESKFDWLQANIWLASKDFASFYDWTNSFDEETKSSSQRFWRGLASLKQQKWQFAIDDLTQGLALSRRHNSQRIDEETVDAQLLIARGYQGLGNQLKSSHYLNLAEQEIRFLQEQGFDSKMIRFHQAALAALKGESQASIALLRQSVQEGFVDFWKAEANPVFISIRDDEGFKLIREELNIRLRLIQNSIESQYGRLALSL
jgi:TolB-like protein/Tfp pilus assembly protein PilF